MGTQITFQGDMAIPKEKLSEFNERVLMILNQGGMMGIEQVELFGKRIALLTPQTPDENGMIVCHYNYFEDDGRDRICYDTKTGQFTSWDISQLQFREVACVVYVLYEFYIMGTALRDGEAFDREIYFGWLNYLFGEKFSDTQTGSCTPVKKIPIALFLNCNGSFDDDRLPFWKPIGDVCISPETQEWLHEIRKELDAICSSTDRPLGNRTMLEVLIDTLYKAKEYGHLYAFQEMFYDFATHPDDRDRQAAVALLQKLVEEGLTELPPTDNGGWFSWQEKRFSPARQRVRRYLAVIGNSALRKEFLKICV